MQQAAFQYMAAAAPSGDVRMQQHFGASNSTPLPIPAGSPAHLSHSYPGAMAIGAQATIMPQVMRLCLAVFPVIRLDVTPCINSPIRSLHEKSRLFLHGSLLSPLTFRCCADCATCSHALLLRPSKREGVCSAKEP